MIYESNDICKLLPHAHPFIMVDRIEVIKPGEAVIGTKAVTYTENFFQGHFPGTPVLPGSIIIEAASQTAGFLVDMADSTMAGFLTEVKEFRFREKVSPGVLLYIEARKEIKKGPFLAAGITVKANDKIVAEGILHLYITKRE